MADVLDCTDTASLRQHVAALEHSLDVLNRQLSIYKGIVSAMSSGLHLYQLEDSSDTEGYSLRMVGVNPAAHTLTGVGEETVGRTLDENFPGLREQGVPQMYAGVVQTGEPVEFKSLTYGDDRVPTSAFEVRALALPDQHIAVLFDNITARARAEVALRAREAQLQTVITNAPIALIAVDREGTITLAQGRVLHAMGLAADALIGQRIDERYDESSSLGVAVRQALGGITSHAEVQAGEQTFEVICTPVYHDDTAAGFIMVGIDISERVQAEEAQIQAAHQNEIIRRQAAMLAELSTPLIPLSSKTVVMPLVGAIDTHRAQQVMAMLLEGVAVQRAETVILDITGVPVVDTQVADALVKAAQAVKLLGAQLVLTGIRPEVAQSLVGLGVSLGDMVTRSTLQSGIAFADRRWGV